MKTFLRILLCVLSSSLVIISCSKSKNDYYNEDGSLVTQQQAIDLVQEIVDMYEAATMSKDIVPANTVLVDKPILGDKRIVSPNYKSWLCVVYKNPGALYVFVNARSGKLEKFNCFDIPDKDIVPCILLKDSSLPKNESQTAIDTNYGAPRIIQKTEQQYDSTNNWAVIISGGANAVMNYHRYWNDCSEIYKTLINVYQYPKSHIFVLMSDGTSSGLDRNLGLTEFGPFDSSPTDLDGDNIADITHSATLNSINTVFTYLGQNVDNNDNVFIFVIDHGVRKNGKSWITLWDGDEINGSNFATQVNKISYAAHKHLVLGQCFSGGLISDLSGANRTISTACSATQVSYPRAGNVYDEFVYHWTNAMRGATPSGISVNADDDEFLGVSFYEAFSYAETNDNQAETPQFYSSDSVFGKQFGLTEQFFIRPTISGSSVSQNNDNIFVSLSDVLTSATVNWNYDSNFTYLSLSGNTIYLRTSISQPFAYETVYANVSTPSVTFPTLSQNITIWNSGYFTDNGEISGSDTYFSVNCPDGAYDFQWGCDNSDWSPQSQGQSFVEFNNLSGDPSSTINSVWVAFRNPFGDQIIIEKQLS